MTRILILGTTMAGLLSLVVLAFAPNHALADERDSLSSAPVSPSIAEHSFQVAQERKPGGGGPGGGGGGGGQTCPAGYADCDGVKSNKCETNIQTDVSNCGACGKKCGYGDWTCENGICKQVDACVGDPCDDGNVCISYSCIDEAVGYSCHPEIVNTGTPCPGGVCDEAGNCVAADKCAGVTCDDGKMCTVDACDPATGGCTHTPNDSVCDDNDICTSDRCDPATGCQHMPNVGTACNDQSACTTNDTCDAAGKCTGTPCEVGYICDGTCSDIDECALGTADCKPGETCINTMGSYSCVSP